MREIDPLSHKAQVKVAKIENGLICFGKSKIDPNSSYGQILLKNHASLREKYEQYIKKHG